MTAHQVPFFRPDVRDGELEEVDRPSAPAGSRPGRAPSASSPSSPRPWGAKHAVALNSCTAALHLALEALGVARGHGVLVPTMTFAATAEVVRYFGAVPLLVDCDPETGNMDLTHAAA
jgi:perosamine synthetase